MKIQIMDKIKVSYHAARLVSHIGSHACSYACGMLICSIMSACGGSDAKKDDARSDAKTSKTQAIKLNENYVDTMEMHSDVFYKQIMCNGKLRAQEKSELSFQTQGFISHIYVKNGSMVSKGALLATLNNREALHEVEQAKREVERARVSLIDKLIGLGYDEDFSKVPPALLERCRITSGHTTAEHQLLTARHNLQKCNLYAPFAGRVADMDSKPYQRADKFCTLISDTWFDVEFSILEVELANVRLGQQIKVHPFSDDSRTFHGTITEINPIVDAKGQIKVRAKVKNADGYLVEGMNVKTTIEEKVSDMYVVPKDAVVMRDGYSVIFCYRDGKAVWTYVDILHSNVTSHAITGNKEKNTTLADGDIVITSGNLNLADATEVIPRDVK